MRVFLRRNALERESEMWAGACVEFKRAKCLCVYVYSCLDETVKCVFLRVSERVKCAWEKGVDHNFEFSRIFSWLCDYLLFNLQNYPFSPCLPFQVE